MHKTMLLYVGRDRKEKLTCEPFLTANIDGRNWYFTNFRIVKMMEFDLTVEYNKKRPRIKPTEDDEEREILEFNNSYTFM